MARAPDRPEGARTAWVHAKVTEQERAALARLAESRDEGVSELVRGIVELLPRLEACHRAVLEEIRGRLTEHEVLLILDLLNGLWLADGLLGEHLEISVMDGIECEEAHRKWVVDSDHLLGELRRLTRAQRIAIETWGAELWRRHEDTAIWASEIEWLASAATTDS